MGHDQAVCQAIHDAMLDNFTDVHCITSVAEGLVNFMQQEYCLIILDAQLAATNDMELLWTIRKIKHTPILVLTESSKPKDKVALFHVGADACIDKPLDINICIAQANALIQLYMESDTKQDCSDAIIFGTKLVICPRYRQAIADGKTLSLTKKSLICCFSSPNPQDRSFPVSNYMSKCGMRTFPLELMRQLNPILNLSEKNWVFPEESIFKQCGELDINLFWIVLNYRGLVSVSPAGTEGSRLKNRQSLHLPDQSHRQDISMRTKRPNFHSVVDSAALFTPMGLILGAAPLQSKISARSDNKILIRKEFEYEQRE